MVPGSRDHCADVCREKVERDGVYYANHVYSPFFYEGTKTYIYEALEQLGEGLKARSVEDLCAIAPFVSRTFLDTLF